MRMLRDLAFALALLQTIDVSDIHDEDSQDVWPTFTALLLSCSTAEEPKTKISCGRLLPIFVDVMKSVYGRSKLSN